MKKEKKAVIKNSEYYYKKTTLAQTSIRLIIPSVLVLLGMTISMGLSNKENYNKINDLKEESGYTQYIQEQKETLKLKYESGEISQNVYNAYLSDVNNITFDGYLKEKDDMLTLAECTELENENFKNILTFAGISTGAVIMIGAAEIGRCSILNKKAKKLKREENKFRIYSYKDGPEPEL